MAEGNPGGNSFSGLAGVIAGVAALITAATGAWMAFNGANRAAPAAASVSMQPAAAPIAVQPVPVTATIVVQPAPAVAVAPVATSTTTTAQAAPAPVAHPGFDCSRASNGVETMICDDVGLAAHDRAMMQVYRQALIVARSGGWDENLRASQRQWLTLRNACSDAQDPQSCIERAYSLRIGQLQAQL